MRYFLKCFKFTIDSLNLGFVIAVIFLLILVGVGTKYYTVQEEQSRQRAEVELNTIARLKVQQLVQWRNERISEGGILTSSLLLGDGVGRWLAKEQRVDKEKILERFNSMQRYSHYKNIMLVDLQRRVRLNISGNSDLHSEELTALETAMGNLRPILTDLHTELGGKNPHLNLIAPILQKKNKVIKPVAAVILTINPSEFLYPMIQSWPTESMSAETLLVRRDVDNALFINETRHQRNTALMLRIPLSQVQVPAVAAILGKKGVFHGQDYRGTKVLSVVYPIPESTWFMVTKIDEVEALAVWRERAHLIVLVFALLILCLIGTTLMFWRQKKTAKDLNRANRAYRVLSDWNHALVHATEELQLLNQVCAMLVQGAGYCSAWVGYAEDDKAKSVHPVAEHGFKPGYLQNEQFSWADEGIGLGPVGTAIRNGKYCLIRGIEHEDFVEYRHATDSCKGKTSSIVLPINLDGQIGGALCIHSKKVDDFTKLEVELLTEMANNLAFGIRTFRRNEERKRGLEELGFEKEKLATAFSSLAIGLVLSDVHGEHISMNQAALNFHGFKSEKDMQTRFKDYVRDWELRYLDGRIMPNDEWPLARAMVGEELSNYDVTLFNMKTNFKRNCSYSSGLVRNTSKEVVLIIITMIDISERIRAEQKINKLNSTLEQQVKEAEFRWKFAIEGSGDGLWDWNVIEGTVFFSTRWKEMLGYSENEIGNGLDEWQSRVHPEDLADTLVKIQSHLDGTTPAYTCEHRMRCKDGSWKWILDRGVVVSRSADRKPLRLIGTHSDISQRKQFEIDLTESKHAAEIANISKSEFLANMSHELRTPLNAIIGFSQALEDGVMGALPDKQREYVHDIYTSGEHLLSLINDILDLSKVESGKMTLELEAVGLHDLLEDSLRMVKEMAMGNNISLSLKMDKDLPDIMIDIRKFKQIVFNLLSNAVKFTPSGGSVVLEARKLEIDGQLEIDVSDNGIGISATDQAQLFQPFKQIDSTLARQYQGTGLGLVMVRRLAELHGGLVGLDSLVGKGSRFWVRIPWRLINKKVVA